VAGWVADSRNNKRQYVHERVRWIVEQQAATLTQLGDALRDLVEAVQVVLKDKQRTHIQSGLWPARVGASDSEWAARSRAFVLSERLQDKTLRDAVDDLTTVTTDAVEAVSGEAARGKTFEAVGRWGDVNKRLGVALRDLYPEQPKR
jgi:hypothetical protein